MDTDDPVVAVITARGTRYGKFKRQAEISQALKGLVFTYRPRSEFDPDMVEALEMILHKIGRLVNGDATYVDSWFDIAGYARLISDRLEGIER